MSLRNSIALTCIAIPAIALIVFGAIYFTASEIMPYHKEFLGVPWSDLEPNVRKRSVNPVLWLGLPSFRFSGERRGGGDGWQTGSGRARGGVGALRAAARLAPAFTGL